MAAANIQDGVYYRKIDTSKANWAKGGADDMWDADVTLPDSTRRLDWNTGLGTSTNNCENPVLLLGSSKGAVLFEKATGTTVVNNIYSSSFAAGTWTATSGIKADGGGVTLQAAGTVYPKAAMLSDDRILATFAQNNTIGSGGAIYTVTGTWSGNTLTWPADTLPTQIQGTFSARAYYPVIASSGTTAYAVFWQDDGIGATIKQRLYPAKFNGTSWTAPATTDAIDAAGGSMKGMSSISMDSTGKAYVTMLQDIGTAVYKIFYNFYY